MSLTEAGIAYACMQGGAMVGRIIVGWAADRSQSALRNMVAQGWAASVLVMVWVWLPSNSGLLMTGVLALVMGLVCASWPGLMLSEISRLAPPGRIADAASGSTMITFMGYVVGPMLFAQGLRIFETWTIPYALVTTQMAAMSAALTVWVWRRERAIAR
jgi:sugar phosphate permease